MHFTKNMAFTIPLYFFSSSAIKEKKLFHPFPFYKYFFYSIKKEKYF